MDQVQEYLRGFVIVVLEIAKVGPLLSAFVLAIGVAIALRTLKAARIKAQNDRTMHLFNRVMDHNKAICEDELQKIVINVFHELEKDNPDLIARRESLEKTQRYELYWAARAVVLSHINLAAQAFVLADSSPERLEEYFPGWLSLAKKTALQLSKKVTEDKNKPDWYRKSCHDLSDIKANMIYGQEFVDFMEKLKDS